MNKKNAVEKLDDHPVVALLGSVPFSGGPLRLLALEARRSREKRMTLFLDAVREDISRLGNDKVDKTYLGSEDFYTNLEFVWSQLAQTRDEQKLSYLKAFFVGAISLERPDTSVTELLRRYLLTLTGSHLALLRAVHDKQAQYSLRDRLHSQATIPGEMPLSRPDLAILLPGHPEELIGFLAIDLLAQGLLGDWATTHQGAPSDEHFVITDVGRLFMRELLRWSVTDGAQQQHAADGAARRR